MMADFTTGAGATFGLSAAAPATFNAAGYQALTFTEVGKITAMSGIPARIFNMVTLNYLASGGTDKAKGSYDLGTTTLTVALDADDAGQDLLLTANDSRNTYSVELTHPVLGSLFAQALVNGQQQTWGDNDTPSTWDVTIEYKIASNSEDGVVAVAAA
jgi:hypothetical protein